jgi:hypothetical protein
VINLWEVDAETVFERSLDTLLPFVPIITRRIGSITPSQESKIRSLSLPQLEELGEALLEFSKASDLEDWLKTYGQ